MNTSQRRERECDPTLHVRVTTLGMGSVSFTTQCATIEEAREIAESGPTPCEVRVYERSHRAVDGAPCLRLLERFVTGEEVRI